MTSSIRTTRTDRPASADRDGYGATIMHNDVLQHLANHELLTVAA